MIEIRDYIRGEHFEEPQLRLLRFGNAKVDSSWCGEIICSAFSRLYYVKKSSFYIVMNGQRIDFTKGGWYLVPANRSYKFGCDGESEHLFFHFNLLGRNDSDVLENQKTVLSLSGCTDEAYELAKSVQNTAAISSLTARGVVLGILLKFIKKYDININDDKYSPCVIKAIEYIKNNLSENLTISKIANGIFVSESTLTKHMRRELSISVNQYIDNLILSRAAQMMVESDLPISAISEHFGFCDQFYFSRKFKAKFGISPAKYKKSWNI